MATTKTTVRVNGVGVTVTYVDAALDIVLRFDSKNKVLADDVSLAEALAITVTKALVDSVSTSEEIRAGFQSVADALTITDVISITVLKQLADTQGVTDIYVTNFGPLNTHTFNGVVMNGGTDPVSNTDISIS